MANILQLGFTKPNASEPQRVSPSEQQQFENFCRWLQEQDTDALLAWIKEL